MTNHHPFDLHRLLAEAVPFEVFVAARAAARPQMASGSATAAPDQSAPVGLSSIDEGVALTQFLSEKGALNLGLFDDWFRHMTAWKNSYGEDGCAAWLAICEAAEGFESEETCREYWDKIKPRTDGPPLTIATYVKQAKELGWKPTPHTGTKGAGRSSKAGDDDGGRVGKPKGVDAAAHAVDLAERAGDEFWVDQEAKPHVSYKAKLPGGDEVLRHARLGSGTYRGVLAERYIRDTVTSVLTNDQATLAIALLEHRAAASGVTHTSALRVGEIEGCVYVDTGRPDGATVRIDGDGYRVVRETPVRFVRGTRGELPDPEAGGTLADFEKHFNLSQDDLRRMLGFLVGCFNVGASYCILMVDGEQGSGKSTLADKAVGLVDPPRQAKSARMSFNPKEQDLHIGALGVHLPFFDNVSTFSADAADALCRLSTGGGSGSRKLYTDDGFHEIVVVRPLVVTCIGAPSSRPDLLDRSLRVTALSLADQRRTERAVMKAYEADRPKMLGFLFACVSAAISNRSKVEAAVEAGEVSLPRMADFDEFVEGAGETLGLELGGFSSLLREGQSAMQTDAVLNHPVGAALIAYFSRRTASREVSMPARDLLAVLRSVGPQDARWPAANVFKKALSRLSVGLRLLGIEWSVTEAEGHDNVARYKVWTTSAFQPVADEAPPGIDDGGGHF